VTGISLDIGVAEIFPHSKRDRERERERERGGGGAEKKEINILKHFKLLRKEMLFRGRSTITEK